MDIFNLAAEDQDPELLHFLFSNRKQEMSDALSALISDQQNVLIAGRRGIGKTSFLKQLSLLIPSEHENILVTYVNSILAFGLIGYQTDQEESIAHKLSLQICQELWCKLFKKPVSDLLEALEKPDDVFTNPKKKKFIRLYRTLRTSTLTSSYSRDSSLGVKIAGIKETQAHKREIGRLSLAEAHAITRELFQIPKEFSYKRLLIMCDEANKLPFSMNDELIYGISNLLTIPDVQFVFSISTNFVYHTGKIDPEHVFDQVIRLECFGHISDFKELLRKMEKACVSKGHLWKTLTEPVINIIWEASQGHPRRTVTMIRNAYKIAEERGLAEISMEVATNTILQTMREEEAYVKSMQRQFPDFEY